MRPEKNLEETIKEKVSVLLGEVMEKSWGITIPKMELDISDKLKSSQLNVYIPLHIPFSEAKQKFKREFLNHELRLHNGNISQLAKFLDMDRRSIHRLIKNLDINVDSIRGQEEAEKYQQEVINKSIRSALDDYKELINPQKMEKIYEEVPELSRSLAKIIPHQHLTWKEAEQEFERQFLLKALTENEWNVSKTARQVKIRAETVHRKIKRLRLEVKK